MDLGEKKGQKVRHIEKHGFGVGQVQAGPHVTHPDPMTVIFLTLNIILHLSIVTLCLDTRVKDWNSGKNLYAIQSTPS